MKFTIECEQETDGRWLAQVMEISGALVYGSSPEEARGKAQALALRVLAERLEEERTPELGDYTKERSIIFDKMSLKDIISDIKQLRDK